MTDIAPFVRQQAGDHAAAIRALSRKTAEHAVEIGKRLTEAKKLLGHGHFGTWLKMEFEWSERTARRFMEVYERFRTANLADLKIGPSALYLLASPSTPESVVSQAFDQAEAGEYVSHADVQHARSVSEALENLPPENAARVLDVLNRAAEAKAAPQPVRSRDGDAARLERIRHLTSRLKKLVEGLGPGSEKPLEVLDRFEASLAESFD